MEVVRAVNLEDIDRLFELIRKASFGLTSLNLSREQLLERLEWSHFAFTRSTERPGGEPYVLVMEDLTNGQLVGTSCIFAKTGGYEPLYTYRRVATTKTSETLGKSFEVESLQLERIHNGPTEIGSLFLMPEYRGKGRGRLLSMSRFGLIAQRPKRFSREVLAEMRGVSHEDGTSPFWESVGRHFFHMDFPAADALSTISKQFIEDLVPQHPIYMSLLPEAARDVIGSVHRNTEPALAMLKGEGFEHRGCIDIFDGGPALHCERDQIRSVRDCRRVTFSELSDKPDAPSHIITTCASDFRATNSPIDWIDENTVGIPKVTALALKIHVGEDIWILPR